MQMAMALKMLMVTVFLTMATQGYAATPGNALSASYYDQLCIGGTAAFQITTLAVVTKMVLADATVIPSLLRLAFHDSFVEGADGSVLLDSDPSFLDVEKNSPPNNPSLRGFEVIDAVKKAVELLCPRAVSCADIVQESARVAMKLLVTGSLSYNIRYGRRDGSISLFTEALRNLPPPFFRYDQLVTRFASKDNLTATDMLLLSGAHCFGVSHCPPISTRLYDFFGNGSGTDPGLDPTYAASLKAQCPPGATSDITVPLNAARNTTAFDNTYFKNIQAHKVLFTSDDQLNVGDPVSVSLYAGSNSRFRTDFVTAMVKLTEVQVTLYPAGQIRTNCRKRN